MSRRTVYSPNVYLAVFLLLAFSAILIPGKYLIIALSASALTLRTLDPGAFRELGKMKFWLFILFIVLVTPAIVGEKNLRIVWFGYSEEYFFVGLRILFRGLSLYMAVLLITRNVSVESLASLFERIGFRKLSVTLPIALNILPVLRSNSMEILRVFRSRGGFRRHRLKNLEKLALTIILSTVRTAEEIYQVIEAKKLSDTSERI